MTYAAPSEPTWRKSSFSGNGPGNECVELAAVGGAIAMRESDAPDLVITTTPGALLGLLRGIKLDVNQQKAP